MNTQIAAAVSPFPSPSSIFNILHPAKPPIHHRQFVVVIINSSCRHSSSFILIKSSTYMHDSFLFIYLEVVSVVENLRSSNSVVLVQYVLVVHFYNLSALNWNHAIWVLWRFFINFKWVLFFSFNSYLSFKFRRCRT